MLLTETGYHLRDKALAMLNKTQAIFDYPLTDSTTRVIIAQTNDNLLVLLC